MRTQPKPDNRGCNKERRRGGFGGAAPEVDITGPAKDDHTRGDPPGNTHLPLEIHPSTSHSYSKEAAPHVPPLSGCCYISCWSHGPPGLPGEAQAELSPLRPSTCCLRESFACTDWKQVLSGVRKSCQRPPKRNVAPQCQLSPVPAPREPSRVAARTGTPRTPPGCPGPDSGTHGFGGVCGLAEGPSLSPLDHFQLSVRSSLPHSKEKVMSAGSR